MLEGSYALCVLNAEAPDTLYCTRKDSPLVVGLSDGAQYVGSDIPALIRHTRTVELLDEREVAVLTRSGVRVYDHSATNVRSSPFTLIGTWKQQKKVAMRTSCSKRFTKSPPR